MFGFKSQHYVYTKEIVKFNIGKAKLKIQFDDGRIIQTTIYGYYNNYYQNIAQHAKEVAEDVLRGLGKIGVQTWVDDTEKPTTSTVGRAIYATIESVEDYFVEKEVTKRL